MHQPAFHARPAFDGAHVAKLLHQLFQKAPAEVGVSDFPAPERNGRFHLVAFLEKSKRMVFLEAVVMLIGVGPELDFFQLHDMLFFLGFVLPFFLLIGILAIVDDLGHGRICGGRNEN